MYRIGSSNLIRSRYIRGITTRDTKPLKMLLSNFWILGMSEFAPEAPAQDLTALHETRYNKYYKSTYPLGVDLTPYSKTHESLKELILERAHASERFMSPLYPQWDRHDETLRFYMPLSQWEKENAKKDSRNPVSIVHL